MTYSTPLEDVVWWKQDLSRAPKIPGAIILFTHRNWAGPLLAKYTPVKGWVDPYYSESILHTHGWPPEEIYWALYSCQEWQLPSKREDKKK